jgi:hypothetical protein
MKRSSWACILTHGNPVLLTAPPKRAHSGHDIVIAQRADHREIVWHGVMAKEVARHRIKPFRLFGDRLVHAPPDTNGHIF